MSYQKLAMTFSVTMRMCLIFVIPFLVEYAYTQDANADEAIFNLERGLDIPRTVLEFIINDIIDQKGTLASGKLYVFIGYNLFPAIIEPDKNLNENHQLNKILLKGKVLIMPYLNLENDKNEWELMIADTRKRQFEYYTFGGEKSNHSGHEWLEIFVKFLTRRNEFVDPKERISTISWRQIAPTVLVKPGHSLAKWNYGVAVIMIVDFKINGAFKFENFVNLYRCRLQQKIVKLYPNVTDRNRILMWIRACDQFGEGLKSIRKGSNNQIKEAVGLLSDGARITDFELDYAVKRIIDHKKILTSNSKYVYIRAGKSSELIQFPSRITRQNGFINIDLSGKILIMPILNEEKHWNVFFADLDNRIFEYYDPLDPTCKLMTTKYEAMPYLKNFLKMLEFRNSFVSKGKRIVNFKNWEIIAPTVKLPTQFDCFNCGIFVIMFIDYRINDRLSFIDNVDLYRRSLFDRFIELNSNRTPISTDSTSSEKKSHSKRNKV